MKSIKHLYRDIDFHNVDRARTKVMPFPGKSPTRWRVTIFSGLGSRSVSFDKIMKPNPWVLAKVLRQKSGYVSLIEFDRGGPFKGAQLALPRTSFDISRISTTVGFYYYPWHAQLSDFFFAWRRPIYVKQMKLGKRVFFVYSPYETMSAEADAKLREYRRWLQKTNLWK